MDYNHFSAGVIIRAALSDILVMSVKALVTLGPTVSTRDLR